MRMHGLGANVIITAVRNASGHLIGFSKITRDLTERRRPVTAGLLLAATLYALLHLFSIGAVVGLLGGAAIFPVAWWWPRRAALLLIAGFVALTVALPFAPPTRGTVIWLGSPPPFAVKPEEVRASAIIVKNRAREERWDRAADLARRLGDFGFTHRCPQPKRNEAVVLARIIVAKTRATDDR